MSVQQWGDIASDRWVTQSKTVGGSWDGFVATQDYFLKQELQSQSSKISVLSSKFSLMCFKRQSI